MNEMAKGMGKATPDIACRILMTLYFMLIIADLVIVYVTDKAVVAIPVILGLTVVCWILISCFSGYLRYPEIKTEHSDTLNTLHVFLIFALSAFLIMLIWFAGYFPGHFTYDNLRQLREALHADYTDWHPAWHTLIIFTLPLELSGGRIWMITFMQIVWFSLCMGYICAVIYKHSNIRYAILTFVYIPCNPYTNYIVLSLDKDVAFALSGGIVMAMTVEIYYTKGEWLKNRAHLLLYAFFIMNVTVLRHNGVLFSGFLILALLMYIHRKRWVFLLFSVAMMYFLVRVVLYNAIDVDPDPQNVLQKTGLSMNIISSAYVETPELMDTEILEFVENVAPRSEWEKMYELGNWGYLRCFGNINEKVFEETGVVPIIRMALKCFEYSTNVSLKSFLATTDIVYGVDLLDQGWVGYKTPENSFGIVMAGNPKLAGILLLYYKIIRLHGYNFLRQSAFALLLMFVLAMSRLSFRIKDHVKLMCLILPIFTYNFGSALLLESPFSRFFFITVFVCPFVIMLLLRKISDDN